MKFLTFAFIITSSFMTVSCSTTSKITGDITNSTKGLVSNTTKGIKNKFSGPQVPIVQVRMEDLKEMKTGKEKYNLIMEDA